MVVTVGAISNWRTKRIYTITILRAPRSMELASWDDAGRFPSEQPAEAREGLEWSAAIREGCRR